MIIIAITIVIITIFITIVTIVIILLSMVMKVWSQSLQASAVPKLPADVGPFKGLSLQVLSLGFRV